MIRNLFACFAIALIAFTASAQKSPVKFGDIPMADLTMTQYDKDSSAAAVFLVDYGEAYITVMGDNVAMTFERHVRIKVLKNEGLSWADVSILLYHSTSEETIQGIKGTTYNLENGKVIETKLSKDGIFKEKFNRNYNRQKFTLPNVKVGSVIEYSYTTKSDFFTRFPNWQFQKDIPVRWSEYWAIIPEMFVYEKYMQGYVPVSTYEVKPLLTSGITTKGHHWITKDVPAFKEEPFITTEDDYVSRVNFALATINNPGGVSQDIMGSWETLNSKLMEDEDFGKVIAKSGFLKDKVEELTAGMTDPMQKITAIHDYVRSTIEWDEVEDFYAGNLKKIIESKKGSSGDINLILASMLDKAGFQVDMVLLSTRDHGIIWQQYPMSRQFNYTICAVKVGDKTLLLDATEKNLPLNVLPERCLNGKGLIISSTFKGWIDLTSKTKSRTVVSAEFNIEEDGDLKGKLTYTHDGYDALEVRNRIKSKGEEAYKKDFATGKSWSIQKTEITDLKELNKPVTEVHEVVISEHATQTGDVIYVNPFLTMQFQENPFKQDQRVYPINFGSPIEKIYMSKFVAPDGYVVDELPPSRALALPGNAGRYSYNAIQNGNVISITSSFQINKNQFLQTEYPYLREFYTQILAKQAEQIVLKKK